MNAILWLLPISVVFSGLGLIVLIWNIRHNQFDDCEAKAKQILENEN